MFAEIIVGITIPRLTHENSNLSEVMLGLDQKKNVGVRGALNVLRCGWWIFYNFCQIIVKNCMSDGSMRKCIPTTLTYNFFGKNPWMKR